MDSYTNFHMQAQQGRDQLFAGIAVDDSAMQSLQQCIPELAGTCSHLALLGPSAIHIAGGVLRDKVARFATTMRLWNEDAAQLPDAAIAEWADILHDEGLEMKAAYQEFLSTSQSVLLGYVPGN
ncbi:hypothetical protein [Streptomyces nigrescens]|nr:hypothetical protein [Streptomyces nigrescens]